MHTLLELRQKQSLPIEAKIIMTKQRIRDWYDYFDGNVYLSFSGGKDSTVLLDIIRKMQLDIPVYFVDTGLEYPEVRQFARSQPGVITVRTTMNFRDVIAKYGYPFISKDVARTLDYKNSNWAQLKLAGLNLDGTESRFKKRYIKYAKALDCDIFGYRRDVVTL